jgi:hypothetical protein
LQYVRDGENVFELDFAGDAVLFLYGFCDFDELGDSGFVIAHGNVSGVACSKRNRQVHGTADELVLNLSLEVVLEVGKVLGNLA